MKYLARFGKIHGPFSDPEFEELVRTGKVQTYSWLWDDRGQLWKALDPAPAHGPAKLAGVVPIASARPSASPAHLAAEPALELSDLDAVCHDYRSLVSGRLARVTETGCELVCSDLEGPQQLSTRVPITLSLLDAKTGRQQSVAAKLIQVKRVQGAWSYQLRWERRPELIAS